MRAVRDDRGQIGSRGHELVTRGGNQGRKGKKKKKDGQMTARA